MNKAPVDWLGNSGTTGNVIAVISAWMWFGNSFIMLMAGVQGINKDYFEAAAIDGAGRWTTFEKITLPLLKADHALRGNHFLDRRTADV